MMMLKNKTKTAFNQHFNINLLLLVIFINLINSKLASCVNVWGPIVGNKGNYSESNRDSKMFMKVSVPPEPCGTDNTGVCLPRKLCGRKKGVTGSSCAQGFGECCSFTKMCTATSRNVDVTEYVTTLLSPDPITTPCTYRIRKQKNACQVLLEFKKFVTTSADTDGQCSTDSLTIRDSITVEDGFRTCGKLTGQHMYLSFGASESIEVRPRITSEHCDYMIVATQIPCSSPRRVPDHCLQYFKTGSGTVKSFDWPNQQQSNQMYAICVENEVGRGGAITWTRCDESVNKPGIDQAFFIADQASPCDLTKTNDWILINGRDRMCDFPSGTQGISSTWSPFLLNVNFDDHEVPQIPWLGIQNAATAVTCPTLPMLYPAYLVSCMWVEPSCQCQATPGAIDMVQPPDIGNTGFCLDYNEM